MKNSKILTVVLNFHQYKTKTYFHFSQSFKSLFPLNRTKATGLPHALQEGM